MLTLAGLMTYESPGLVSVDFHCCFREYIKGMGWRDKHPFLVFDFILYSFY